MSERADVWTRLADERVGAGDTMMQSRQGRNTMHESDVRREHDIHSSEFGGLVYEPFAPPLQSCGPQHVHTALHHQSVHPHWSTYFSPLTHGW